MRCRRITRDMTREACGEQRAGVGLTAAVVQSGKHYRNRIVSSESRLQKLLRRLGQIGVKMKGSQVAICWAWAPVATRDAEYDALPRPRPDQG